MDMAELRQGEAAAPPRSERARSGYPTYAEDDFSGWAWFTGGLMALVGVFQVIVGITALANAATFTVPSSDLVIDTSYTTWGWVHLVLGLLFLATGGGLAFGQTWARVTGVVLVALGAIVMFGFLPAAPVAVTVIIGIYVFLIYGISVHGGEGRPAR
jgi:hypothetical protein